MLKRFLDYIRITPHTLLVVFCLLALIDGGVRYYWANLYQAPGRVRLVNEELATLETMQNEIRSARGFKILFLGDSAAYGSAVKDSSQTIPAFLEQELNRLWPGRDVRVFNYAFKGYGMSENYFVLNSLADTNLDMVIYNVSTGWFNMGKALEHPNVVLLSNRYFGQAQIAKTGVKTERSKKDKWAAQVNRVVGTGWSFYQNRSAISTMILGKPIRAKLTDWQLALTNPAELAKRQREDAELFLPWDDKDWSIKLGQAGYQVGYVNLSQGNPQVIFYRLILSLLTEKKIKSVIYTSPQNFTLLDRYNMLDRGAWAKSIDTLRNTSVRNGVYFTDYTNLVDQRYFSDTVHLVAQGNRDVARQLARDISVRYARNNAGQVRGDIRR